jgi:DNA polymerase III subunit alpha
MTVDVSACEVARPMVVTLAATKVTPPVVEQLKDVLATHPGLSEVHLRVTSTERTMVVRLDERLRVDPGAALRADLKALLGPGCIAS